jgi:hypothetical protein
VTERPGPSARVVARRDFGEGAGRPRRRASGRVVCHVERRRARCATPTSPPRACSDEQVRRPRVVVGRRGGSSSGALRAGGVRPWCLRPGGDFVGRASGRWRGRGGGRRVRRRAGVEAGGGGSAVVAGAGGGRGGSERRCRAPGGRERRVREPGKRAGRRAAGGARRACGEGVGGRVERPECEAWPCGRGRAQVSGLAGGWPGARARRRAGA